MEKVIQKECKHHGMTAFVLDYVGTYRCRKCRVEAVTKRRRLMKLRLIEYLGGSCIKCGYNKCQNALEFHHRDVSQKDFHISNGKLISFDRMKVEVDKCDLVCANCHREIHAA